MTDDDQATRLLRDREHDLQVSRTRLDETQRIAKLGSWEFDLLTGALFWSDQIFEIFGLDPKSCEASYTGFLEQVHPDDREAVDNAYTLSLYDGKPYEMTFRLALSGGVIKWVQQRCESDFDAEGEPFRSVGTVQDVTARVQREKAMSLKTAAIESSINAITFADLDGRITYVNSAFLRLWESSNVDDVIGREGSKFWGDFMESKEVRAALRRHCGWSGEVPAQTRRGAELVLQVSVHEVRELLSGGASLMASFVDITERRRAERRLLESQRRQARHNEMLVAAAEAQTAYLVRGDWKAATGRLLRFALEVSDSSCGFLGVMVDGPRLRILFDEGLRPGILTGHAAHDHALAALETHEHLELSTFDNLFGRAITSGQTVIVNEVPDERLGDESLRYGFLGSPVRAGDTVIGMLGLAFRPGGYPEGLEQLELLQRLVHMAEPICDSYLIDRDRRRLLEQQRRASERIQASLREKETLLREIHHRVKNNLQIVSSLLFFQSKKADSPQDLALFEELRERLAAMTLVHEKLYQSDDLGTVDFDDYVRSLALALGSSNPSRHSIPIEVVVAPVRLPLDLALPAGMIVSELLTNVFKHAFPRGHSGSGSVRVRCEGGSVVLEVSDDGVGLATGVEPKSDDTFGWKLLRSLVRQLDGELEIEDRNGVHAKVIFPLPEDIVSD